MQRSSKRQLHASITEAKTKSKRKRQRVQTSPTEDTKTKTLLGLVVSVRWLRRTLRRVQPLDMSQLPTHLALLLLRTSHLLLLLGLELERSVLCVRDLGTWQGGRGRCVAGGADVAAGHGAAADAGAQAWSTWCAVLEAVERDGKLRFRCQATGVDVPLFWAQGADEFFVVGNHDDTTLIFADGDGKTSNGVTVQKVGWFVEDE